MFYVYLFIYLFIHPFIYLFIYLFIHLFIYLFILIKRKLANLRFLLILFSTKKSLKVFNLLLIDENIQSVW